MRSLRSKLILGFLAVSALGIGLGMLFAGVSASGEFRRFVFSRNQEDLLHRLTAYYADHGDWAGVEVELANGLPPPPEERPHLRGPGMLTLVDANGQVIIGGPGVSPGQQLSSEALSRAGRIEVDGRTVGWLIVPGDAFAQSGGESLFFRRVTNTLLMGAAAALAVALISGALVARSLTRPLLHLTAATQAVASGDFGRTVPVASRDELGQLADSFNRMSETLEASRRQRRQMTADIAHELRTPLTIIQGHLDAIEDGVIESGDEVLTIIREETTRLARLIEDLRILTRADAGELTLSRRPTDLVRLARQAVGAHRPQASAKAIGLSLEQEGEPDLVEADPDRISQVLDNLLSNAIRHTPRGGEVVVGVSGSERETRLWVKDTGKGIDPDDLGHVFERFYRTDKSRRREDGGSGLGLAIARSIVEAHGWTISAESPPGEGATLVIRIPRDESARA
jgi:two-component system sensor histidine kinase BaeS